MKNFILICVGVATATILSIYYYNNKLQDDMGLKRIAQLEQSNTDLTVAKAKQESDIDATKKQIEILNAQLSGQQAQLSTTIQTISNNNTEIAKIKKALYYLNESLGIQND